MKRSIILFVAMVISSIFIAWLDTQNNAEETGVEFAYVLMIASVFGLLWGEMAASSRNALLFAVVLTTPAVINGLSSSAAAPVKLLVAFVGLNIVGRLMQRSNR